MGSFYNGLSGKCKDDFNHGDARFVTYRNVFSNTFASENQLEKIEIKPNEKQNKISYGDVIFTQSSETFGELGLSSVWLHTFQPYLNSFCIGWHPNEITSYSPKFMGYLLRTETVRKQIIIQGQGISRINLSANRIENIKLYFPNYSEQLKIAELMSLIDQKIEKQQQLVELLKKYKKGLLLCCLPENNKTSPHLRFEQFNEKWIPKKLGEVAKVTMGQSPDGKTYSSIPSDYILIQGNADLQNGWVTPRIWTTQITKMAQKGDLIMSVRAPAGAMGKTSYDAVIGRGVASIKGNEFIYQSLIKMDLCGYWKKLSTGSTFESLNSDNIKSAKIMLPPIHEQNYIGEYLSKIDKYIICHEKKLELLNNMKKAFLQDLFI